MIAGRLNFSSLDHRLVLTSQPSSLHCSSVATRPAPRSSSHHRCSAERQLLTNDNVNVWTGVWTGDRKAECETCGGKGAIPCSVGVGVRGSMADMRNDKAAGGGHFTKRVGSRCGTFHAAASAHGAEGVLQDRAWQRAAPSGA